MAAKKTANDKSPIVWASLRISLGFIFLWAFVDKLVGLGFATCRDATTDTVSVMCSKSWLEGGSPTLGFLKFGTKGPLADFYQGLAGLGWVDWLFMLGLLLIGLALITGVAQKLATISGSLLLLMMWSATLLPANNPILDDHLIYILVLWGIYVNRNNAMWSLHNWWVKQPLVKMLPILK
jgi:thiosulfate dehydrogenase (quinone) large subunit